MAPDIRLSTHLGTLILMIGLCAAALPAQALAPLSQPQLHALCSQADAGQPQSPCVLFIAGVAKGATAAAPGTPPDLDGLTNRALQTRLGPTRHATAALTCANHGPTLAAGVLAVTQALDLAGPNPGRADTFVMAALQRSGHCGVAVSPASRLPQP